MKQTIYGMLMIHPVNFPDAVELHVKPFSREGKPSARNIQLEPPISWEEAKQRYNIEAAEDLEQSLHAGNDVDIRDADYLVDIPDSEA